MWRLTLLLICLPLFWGCPGEVTAPHYHSFAWLPDGAGIVAIEQDFSDPTNSDFGNVVVTYDPQGNEVARVKLQKKIKADKFFDRLYFTNIGKGFLGQTETDLSILDYETGSALQLLIGQTYITASKSGNLLLTWIRNTADSITFTMFSITGTLSRRISQKTFFSSVNAYRENTAFIGDSSWIGCTLGSPSCSVEISDTLFLPHYLGSSNARAPMLPVFANQANKIAYVSQTGFSIYDFATNSESLIKGDTSRVVSMDISPEAKFLVYTVNDDGGYTLAPGKLRILDILTKEVKELASGLVSGVQLSPDGKQAAYFTRNDQGVQLHLITVP